MDQQKDSKSNQMESVSFFGLFAAADSVDYVLIFLGSIRTCVHGAALPLFIVLFSRVIDSLGHLNTDPHKMSSRVSEGSYSLTGAIESNKFGLFATSTALIHDAPAVGGAVQGVPSIEKITFHLLSELSFMTRKENLKELKGLIQSSQSILMAKKL